MHPMSTTAAPSIGVTMYLHRRTLRAFCLEHLPHPCKSGCLYARDVDMPEHRCAGECWYDVEGAISYEYAAFTTLSSEGCTVCAQAGATHG
jgi:hypothetical protein